jgi:hypothetical protein
MTASEQAAAAIALATALIVAMDWLPTPLNRNISGMPASARLPSTAIHGSIGILLVLANLLRWKWVVLAGALWYTLVLVQGIRNWWVAYLLGVHAGEITPEEYRAHYAENVRFLPRIGDHPVIPDVQHTLIHLSVLAASALSWTAFVSL